MTGLTVNAPAYISGGSQDQELESRLRNRRNHLLGLWAAERLGLRDEAAAAYARDLVSFGIEAADGGETSDGGSLAERISGDCAAHSKPVPIPEIVSEMQRLERIAALELAAPGPAETASHERPGSGGPSPAGGRPAKPTRA